MCAVIVVGGGPVGVGVAGEIEDFLRQDIPRLYPMLAGVPSVTIVHDAEHILNVYDERISRYAEAKLAKDRVRVLTGRTVREVRAASLLTTGPSGAAEEMPFGLCVWTTGLGTRPVARALQRRLGHAEGRTLAVNARLAVSGADGVFALGDCADVKEGAQLACRAAELFELADTDRSGTVDVAELKELLAQLRRDHPHVAPLLAGGEVAALVRRAGGGGELTRGDFAAALQSIDRRAASHPATAQVAAQQGAYLAKALNAGGEAAGPFRYRHLGSFVQLGGSQAAMQMPGDVVSTGFSTMVLWCGAYFGEQVSWRNRWLMLSDWLRVRAFGRDSSRM